MKLTVKNIGKVREAEIRIDGITVVCGINDSGKSTIGKVVYSFFDGMSNLGGRVSDERRKKIEDDLWRLLINQKKDNLSDVIAESGRLSEKIVREKDYYGNPGIDVNEKVRSLFPGEQQEGSGDSLRVYEAMFRSLETSDREISERILENSFMETFNGQIRRIGCEEESEASLYIKNEPTTVTFPCNGGSAAVSGIKSLWSECFYFDSPAIIDDLDYFINMKYPGFSDDSHGAKILRAMTAVRENVVDQIEIDKSLKEVMSKIEEVCRGSFVFGKAGASWNFESNISIKPGNLSAGLKLFTIIKTLLKNGSIRPGYTLLFDEPEINLHPEWQIRLAEILVLLQREFALHLIVSTHSPYFLRALDIFVDKYGTDKTTSYYLATDEGGYSLVRDVSGNIEEIYRQMTSPFQKLENLRYDF